ncbi:MAG: hypothetical protein J7599_05620 [Niabella sp.]|nr:hypothetical protein [Niabella sp.]
MKTLPTTDPFQTECWSLEKTINPYRVFVRCFIDAGDLHKLRKLLLHVFLFIHPFRPQHKERFYDVHLAFMAINSVIEAAHYLCNSAEKQDTTATPSIPNSLLKNDMPVEDRSFISYFISLDEYLDPFKVFRAFFEYQSRGDWRSNLHEILYYCMTDASIEVEMDLFSLWLHLTKLLEAAYITVQRRTCFLKKHRFIGIPHLVQFFHFI